MLRFNCKGLEGHEYFDECLAEPVVHQTFVHRDDGKRYTYGGISP